MDTLNKTATGIVLTAAFATAHGAPEMEAAKAGTSQFCAAVMRNGTLLAANIISQEPKVDGVEATKASRLRETLGVMREPQATEGGYAGGLSVPVRKDGYMLSQRTEGMFSVTMKDGKPDSCTVTTAPGAAPIVFPMFGTAAPKP